MVQHLLHVCLVAAGEGSVVPPAVAAVTLEQPPAGGHGAEAGHVTSRCHVSHGVTRCHVSRVTCDVAGSAGWW